MSRIRRVAMLSAAAVALLAVLPSAGTAMAGTAGFTIVSSPNRGTSNNQLLGVAAAAASDAWAVGWYQANSCLCSRRTLSEHWNGSGWSIVSTPNRVKDSTDYDTLQAVAAVSTGDVWAVGDSGNPAVNADKTLIEHWNGTSWSVVKSANPSASQDLYGVAGDSSSDAWAVGVANDTGAGSYGSLIEHWNGTGWTAVSNPGTQRLWAVAVRSGNDAWAVGDPMNGSAEVLHWNGTRWSAVSSPQGDYYLRSVAAISASDVWAVGYKQITSGEGYVYASLVEHWDGSSWSLVGDASPYPASSNQLFGVAAPSGTKVWAAGTANGLSFVESWNGSQWTAVHSANIGTSNNTLQTVAVNSGSVWTAGAWHQAASPYNTRTLVEQCLQC